jgi:hypothetical protein
VTPVTATGFGAQHPDFSPDGSAIAFEGPGSTIYTIPAGGGSPRQILSDATSPAWSPYAPPGSAGSTTALRLSIRTARDQRVLKEKGLIARAQCNVACTVAAAGAVTTSKTKSYTTKTVVTAIPAGRQLNIELPLSTRALRAIAKALSHHKRVVAVLAAVAQANGVRKRATTAFTVHH